MSEGLTYYTAIIESEEERVEAQAELDMRAAVLMAPDPEEITDEKIERARVITIHELNRNHGSFVTAFLEAFLRADRDNVRILYPAFLKLREKYHLDKTEYDT